MASSGQDMHPSADATSTAARGAAFSRRSFIRNAARTALVGAVGLPLLAACGGAAAPASSPAAKAGSAPASSAAPAAKPSGAASSAPASAAPASSSGEKPKYGGALKIAWVNTATVFGFPAHIAGLSTICVNGVLEPLLDFDKNLHFKPTNLATALAVGKDGKSLTMTLRKGVKFHDGTDFNAAAVKWNLDQVKAAKALGTANWASTDVVDDYTVRLNLSQPDGTVPNVLGGTVSLQVSPTAVQKNGVDWAKTHPVGTGPFKFVSFQRDVSLKYERFDGYWGDKPYLDAVEWQFIKDPMLQEAAFKNGEANMLYYASPMQLKTLSSQGYQAVARVTGNDALMPASSKPDSPLSKLAVRQALEYAIDRNTIANSLGYGYWKGVDQVGLADYPLGYDPNFKGRAFDPAKAKQLLAEAGYANGLKTSLIADEGFNAGDYLTAIQGYWQKVGVDAAIQIVPRAKYEEYRTQGWPDGFVDSEMGADPMYLNTLDRFISPTSKVYVTTTRPAGWAQMENEAKAQTNPDAMATKTRAMIKKLYDDATFLPLWSTVVGAAVLDKSVRNPGFLTDTFWWIRWTPKTVWISK